MGLIGTSPDLCLGLCSTTQCVYSPLGAFEIEINGQLVFSKLENGGFPYEKDVSVRNTGWDTRPPTPTMYHTVTHLCPCLPPSSSSRPFAERVMENPWRRSPTAAHPASSYDCSKFWGPCFGFPGSCWEHPRPPLSLHLALGS